MTVTARKPDLSLAIGLAEEAASPHTWYGLGRRETGLRRLIVVRGAAPLDSVMRGRGPSWGAGFALPAAGTVVIRADVGDPHRILQHELAHLVLHEAVPVRVPLWFDEGYAALAAGEWDRLDLLQLNLTVARGRVPGFFELDRSLRSTESTAQTAYALAASAVALLARRHPDHSLAPLLSHLAGGEGFDDAVLATTGSRTADFEGEWQKDVRSRYGLAVWAIAGGFWLLMAGLVVLASWYRRRRDVPRRLALDQGWPLPPEPEEPPLDEAGPAP